MSTYAETNEILKAISELKSPTVDQILELFNQISYDSIGQAADNVVTFFHSGELGDLGVEGNLRPLRILDEMYGFQDAEGRARMNYSNESQIFVATEDPRFVRAMQQALGSPEAFEDFMYGALDENGIRALGYFDTMSANLTMHASGDVIALVPTSTNIDSVWFR